MALSLEILLFVLFVFLLALFAALEVAFVSTSRLRALSLFKQGKRGSRSLLRLKEQPRRLLITILLWSNATNVAASALATLAASSSLGSFELGLVVGGVTLVLLVFGEVIPKTFAAGRHEQIALLLAPPTELLVAASAPLVLPLEWFSRSFTRAFAGREAKKPLITEEDLDSLVSIGVEEGTIGANEARLVRRSLDFNDHFVEQVMTPVSEVEFLNEGMNVEDALSKSVPSRHHRFPVRDSRGHVVGVVHEKLLLDAISKGKGGGKLVGVMQPPVFFKPHTSVSEVFETLLRKKRKLAVIAQEAGLPLGIITLEDIVVEIVEDLRGFEADPLAKM